MPLVHNTVYTIRNDLTHTVLDLPDPTDDPEVVGASTLYLSTGLYQYTNPTHR